jgi:hypothetical protein
MSLADDDDFAKIMEGVDLTEPTDVVDVSRLDDKALMDLFADTRERLKQDGMYSDLQSLGSRESTREERDLHSLRLACLAELRKRGLG